MPTGQYERCLGGHAGHTALILVCRYLLVKHSSVGIIVSNHRRAKHCCSKAAATRETPSTRHAATPDKTCSRIIDCRRCAVASGHGFGQTHTISREYWYAPYLAGIVWPRTHAKWCIGFPFPTECRPCSTSLCETRLPDTFSLLGRLIRVDMFVLTKY